MISTLTLVSLGLLQTGAIEIVMVKEAAAPAAPKSNVVDPAKAEIADIDAAVRDYAESAIGPGELGYEIPADAVTEKTVNGSDDGATFSSSSNYRLDQPHPPVPSAEAATEDEITIPVGIAKNEFELEGLKPSTAFVVLRQEERPSWVGGAPQLKGNGEHFIAVASDPWKTDFEASESLEKKLRTAVDDYINDQIGRPDAARRIHLPQEDVDQLIGERYAEDLQFSDDAIGAMKQVHAKLVFTPQFRAAVAERWKEHVVNGRLLRTGLASAGVLMLLVMAFGVLKRLGRR